MKKLLVKFGLKFRYSIDCQAFERFESPEPTLVILPWASELDPLLCKLYWKTSPLKVLVPIERIKKGWIRWILKPFVSLPVFNFKTPLFYRKRLQKTLDKCLKEGEDLVVVYEGAGNPVISLVLQKYPSIRVVLCDIQIKGRKVKIAFTDLTGRMTVEKTPAEIDTVIQQTLSPRIPEKRGSFPEAAPLIKAEIARLARREASTLDPGMHLYDDLGLDSLDVTEIVVFLQQRFKSSASFGSLERVQDVLEAAEVKRPLPAPKTLEEKELKKWSQKRLGVKKPEGKTIGEAFLRVCERMGSSLACVDPQEAISYVRLKSLALGLVSRLKKIPGERIGILLPPLGETYAMVLGLFLAQKTVVMLNSTQGPKHLDEVIQSAGLKAILTTSQVMEHLAWDLSDELEDKLILLEKIREELTYEDRLEGLRLARQNTEELLSHLNLNQLTGEETAVILFTSGTEKSPKGVPLSHHNLLSNHRDISEAVLFKEEDVLLGILPAFHVYGFSMTGLFPLLSGLRVIFHPSPLDLQGIARQVHKWGATMIATAPTLLKNFLLTAAPEGLTTVRLWIVGAEKTPADLPPLIERKTSQAQLLEGYGLTECSPVLTLHPGVSQHSCVGRPLRHVQILVVDPETKTPVPPENEGLILARGPNVFAGYLQVERQPFVEVKGEKWFVTEDVGYIDQAGTLYLVGRRSRTVKIGGEMISLGFVEDLLVGALGPRFPALQIAIMGEEDARKGTHLILYTNQNLSMEEVNHLLHEGGASNLLKVREVRILPSLPMTALGKIDYKKLK
ncbi:MAG: AMP-binding protein [Verrucomicrobia bacterium]|nr:AMP-binding protein [Verrucomicrobiota bacterium]